MVSSPIGDGSFNPCSNGMKKELRPRRYTSTFLASFNPCSNGMKKERITKQQIPDNKMVLILVLME